MQTHSLTWLKKLVAGAAMALVLATPAIPAFGQEVPPEVTYSYADPTSFDPSQGEDVKIYWYLAAQNANVEIDVYDGKKSQGGSKVRDLVALTPWYNVPNPATWNGEINGEAAAAGTYYYYVTATNGAGSFEWEQSFQVTGTGTGGNGGNGGSGSAPVVGSSVGNDSGDYASPNPFDPNTEVTRIYYSLSAEADVYITIKDSTTNQTVETLFQHQTAGSNRNQIWDGKNNSSQAFPERVYDYEIYAANQYGTNTEDGTVEIEYAGGNGGNGQEPVIGSSVGNDSGDYASPNPFDPNTEVTRIYYDLSAEADVYITIKDSTTNQTVETLFQHQTAGDNRNQIWDGKNNSSQAFPERVYNYEIYAANQYGTNTEDGTVEIEYAGGSGGSAPVIGSSSSNDSDDFASPNPFDPNTESTTIYYNITNAVDSVVVKIKDGNSVIETVTGTSSQAVWDGKNSSNQPFAEKVYDYEIVATNSQGSDTEDGTVEIEYDGGSGGTAPVIGSSSSNDSNDYAQPNPFDPNDESTTIHYTLNTSVDSVVVKIKDGSSVIETVNGGEDSGPNTAVWDGKDNSNDPFDEKVYDYEIVATNSEGTDTEDGTVEIEYDGGSEDAPEITEQYADPFSFDPTDGEETDIYFRIANEDADVTVEILEGNNTIVTLVDDAHADEGLSFVEWDGEDDDNDIVDEGMYAFKITACDKQDSNECDTAYGSVQVDYDGGGSTGDMHITNDYADPDPFNPDDENTRIYYTLNKDADVTIEIIDEDHDIIRTLLDDVRRDDGGNHATWNGEDRYGDEVDEGDYTYRIIACAANESSNCDTESGEVRVDYDISGNDDLISDVEVNNAVFDPEDDEESEVCFDIEEDNTEITIEILDGNRVIETLVDEREYDASNDRCFEWNGEDDDGDIVDDDVYQFRIRAEKGNNTEVEYAYTEVDTDGRLIGFPDDDDYCAGFWDIPSDSPFCEAIKLMHYRGIFTGYPDGSFQPYADINRAETAKVVLLALDYGILSDDGSNLGYWDVQQRSWYMPYLRTAQREGIATGYPDRSFRPGGTINRVELLRVFLEGSDINVPHCNYQPYPDTPVNSDTRWYMDYACFAKAYGLMGTDANGNFNPAEPMSRADVAMLFYNFEKRGLFAGYNPDYYNGYYSNFDSNYFYPPGYDWYDYDDNNNNDTDDLIEDIEVDDDVFDPDRGERSRVCFDILEDNTDISIDVLDDDRDRVRELVDDVEYDESNNRCYSWDGEDDDGDTVRDGDYEFRIKAEKGNDDQVEYADVEVNT